MTQIEQIAKAAHEMNRRYCQLIGDGSQKPWEESPEWQRGSAIAGVKAVLSGGIKTLKEQHDAWSQRKLNEGWTRGDVKDAKAKTHPCLVPYNDLPVSEQQKDAIFRATVKGIAHHLGLSFDG